MKFLSSLKMMRRLRCTQIWPEWTQISASPSERDLVRRKTAELSEICYSFPRDERWGLELKTWQMKCRVTYSCWTQISASPWWRKGWSTEWPTPVGPRSLRVRDGGGDEALSGLLLLDPDLCESMMEEVYASCEGWTTRERVLESARRDEPGRFSD